MVFLKHPTKEETRMPRLEEKNCVPCRGGVPALTAEQVAPLAREVKAWEVIENHHLHRLFKLPDFQTALDFVNRIGEIAEREDHHPDIQLSWGKVGVTIWTHKVDGLTENDFILAAKIDRVFGAEGRAT
jgi:4a-hydroxytetrahydrobiopterin dehydratase